MADRVPLLPTQIANEADWQTVVIVGLIAGWTAGAVESLAPCVMQRLVSVQHQQATFAQGSAA